MDVSLWITVVAVFTAFMAGMLVTALLANQRIGRLYDEIAQKNRELETRPSSTFYRPMYKMK